MVTWIQALTRTRDSIGQALRKAFFRPARPADVSFEELEEALIGADVPVRFASEIVEKLRSGYDGLDVPRKEMLRKMLADMLGAAEPFAWGKSDSPRVILIVGVNGSGKTTTCAKLARLAAREGATPMLAATDTFRAAGADQLAWWAKTIGCDVVAGKQGADAAAVAYDAAEAALSRGRDVVIVDTAGRMHTREPLMRELQKVRGALAKRLPGAPHETWIVLDASIGQNAVVQARVFHDAVPLTGAVIAKLDGSAKAGFVFSVSRELGIPIRFAGLGEGPDDLVPFNASEFAAALLADEAAAPQPS